MKLRFSDFLQEFKSVVTNGWFPLLMSMETHKWSDHISFCIFDILTVETKNDFVNQILESNKFIEDNQNSL